jgi:hypothetical protein
MSRHSIPLALAAAVLVLAAGCGDSESVEMEGMQAEAGAEAEAPMPSGPHSVTITSPQNGDTIRGGTVQVVLQVTGLRIVEAGIMEPNTGHHHLYFDADLTALDAVVPAGVAGVTHMGLAQTEYTYEGVAPGQHRLIAVVGDGAHLPLSPTVVDTVTFTVVAAP